MITKMKKLTFLVYHKEYETFLKSLRDAGVVHIEELERGQIEDPELQEKLVLSKQISETLKRLQKLDVEQAKKQNKSDGAQIMSRIESLEQQMMSLKQEASSKDKLIETLSPWGDFEPKDVEKLLEVNLEMNFFICNESNFEEEWIDKYNAVIISKLGSRLHFITLTAPGTELYLNAEFVKLPPYSLDSVNEDYCKARDKITAIEEEIAEIAKSEIDSLTQYLKQVQSSIEFEEVKLNTQSSVEDKLMVLQGWIPATESSSLVEKLEDSNAYYEIVSPKPGDNVPIQLANKGLFSWFEPIMKLYMLPKYNELDLTPFFAPFFMIFFGLCLGDSGYGLFLFVAATLYKSLAKNISATMKPIMSLVQVLGASTFFCGLLTGGFFGVNLYEIDLPIVKWLNELVYLDNNQMFVLSLVLGVIQILFGMVLKAVNETIQFGFKYAVGTIGWIIFLVYTFLLAGFPSLGALWSLPHLVVTAICGAMIFLYNSPDKNILVNVGLGFWDSYNMATGLLGDILSYVRLFALGLSGGILASVFNNLALGMSPDNVILGPIVMVLIFVIGHSINIFMNVLGAMVHPMRLTFVEFFKNAGYEGGGKEYKPFKRVK